MGNTTCLSVEEDFSNKKYDSKLTATQGDCSGERGFDFKQTLLNIENTKKILS